MALWRSPNTGFSTHKLPPPAPLLWLFTTRDGYFRWVVYRKGTCRSLPLSCSAKNLGGGKNQRQSRACMNDSDLRKELVEFVSGEGLPEGDIPPTAELSKRGRNDAIPRNALSNESYGVISLEVDETDMQTEIEKLRVMLQEKEMDLLQLRQEIEKKKLALSNFQNKASAEMEYIHSLMSQKDSEISASEERLLGLKEVLIEYQGHGNKVEIAGSFNGWHHRVKLDHHTSVNLDSIEDRDGSCWVATLWLYPGIYEVKFIVDGHWKTDPHHETITRGHITNNVIRVER